MTEYTPAQRKALETGKSICVTAGAGTGKTFLLTQRYLMLLKTGVLPRDIVALTYTEKAAAEMQTKISRELKRQADIYPELAESWENFPQATINTFHGFCLSILKEFAYEAGLDPGFTIMDELDKTELVERTIRDVLENPPEELFETAVRIYAHSGTAVIPIIRQMTAEKPDSTCRDAEELHRRWVRAYRKLLEKTGANTTTEFFSLLDTASEEECLFSLRDWFGSEPTNRSLLNRLEASDKKSWRGKYLNLEKQLSSAKTAEDIRSISRRIPSITAKDTKAFAVSDSEINTVKMFVSVLKTISFLPAKDSEAVCKTQELIADFRKIANYCRKKIAAEKLWAGILDFDDLLEKTAELLSDAHPEIFKTVSSRYRYVLVDEVQDNDPKLISLVLRLCGNPKETDKLFIVGDAKQSIYQFRNADVAGYMQMQNQFPDEPIALDTSFRSAPVIIDFVNSLFAEIFQNRTNPWDPGYDPIQPSRTADHGSVQQILIPYTTDKAAQKQTEADALASWIYDAVVNQNVQVTDGDTLRPAAFSDVAILLEKRTRLPYIRRALERYGIPYDEAAGKDFYTKQETFDLYNLLSAVLYPEDDIPLYGALRSPYFSLSDAELEQASAKTHGTLYARLKSFAKEQPKSKIADVLSTLVRWKSYASHLPPTEALWRMIAESEILSIYAAVTGGARKEGNLRKLLDILRSKTSVKPFSLYEFCALLETSMESSLQEGDGDPADGGGNRVRILTVHASKGLEYPIVCCAYAGDRRKSKPEPIVYHEELGFGVSVHVDGEKLNLVKELISAEREEKEEAEHKRLMYVALTRARDHLVFCGSQETERGAAEKSFLWMYERAESALTQKPELFEAAVCSPPDAGFQAEYSAGGAVSVPLPYVSLDTVDKEGEFAMARGSRLHAVFAGETDDEEFATQYAKFLSSPLMEGVVFEQCELPVMIEGKRRVIDRFVQYADGSYAVIDYKTGLISTAKKSGRFAEYSAQVEEYVELMREMTGKTVSGWLYFPDEKEGGQIIHLL